MWSSRTALKGCATDEGTSPGGTGLHPCLLLFATALLARATYLFIYEPTLESYYLALADSLVRTGVLGFDGTPSTGFEPGYPLFLAGARLMFGERIVLIQLLQACIGAAGAVLMYRLALHLGGSRRTAVAAASLFAIHPLLIRQASAASDLTLTTTLLLAATVAFERIRGTRSAAVFGLLLGLTVLTRSMVLPLVPLAAGLVLARRRLAEAAAAACVALAVMTPMVVRTFVLSGSLAPTRSGVALYIGNSPYTAALLPTYDLDLLEPDAYERFVRARPDVDPDSVSFDAEFDAYLTGAALEHMGRDPVRTVRQKLRHAAYLVSPRITPLRVSGRDTRIHIDDNGAIRVLDSLPRSRLEVWSHAAMASLLLAGTLAGAWYRRGRLRGDAMLWAAAATFVLVNVMYVPATRYMSPVLFVMMFYTAVAVDHLWGRSEDRHLAA